MKPWPGMRLTRSGRNRSRASDFEGSRRCTAARLFNPFNGPAEIRNPGVQRLPADFAQRLILRALSHLTNLTPGPCRINPDGFRLRQRGTTNTVQAWNSGF